MAADRLPKEHRTVSRVMAILEKAGEAPKGVSLADLSEALNAPKSSVHGLVKGLVATGYLQEHKGVYSLGPAVGMLPAPSGPAVLEGARRSLEEVERRCEESVMLSTLIGESVVYADVVESRNVIRYVAPKGVRRPLYPTSAGKCFLARFSPARRDGYLQRQGYDEKSRDAVRAELEKVLHDGFSTNHGETVPDVYAVSTPIMVGGKVVACLSAAGPGSRFEPKMAEISRLLVAEAARLAQSRG